jgi:hypothetical protein
MTDDSFKGVNPWQFMYDTFMVFYQVFVSLFCAVNLCLAVFRLVKHVQADGCRKRLPQACLQLIIVGNICKLIIFTGSNGLQSDSLLQFDFC